jgi:hypothetical protein
MTGAWTAIGGPQGLVYGADFGPSGALYGITPGNLGVDAELITVNTNTGGHTAIGLLDQFVGLPQSIVFDPANGTLIGSALGQNGGPETLFDIDANDASVTNIRNLTGSYSAQGMGFALACSGS